MSEPHDETPGSDDARAEWIQANSVMLKVNGTTFRCRCGANVLHWTDATRTRAECNGCGTVYEAEPGDD